jgi:hypothetical protein
MIERTTEDTLRFERDMARIERDELLSDAKAAATAYETLSDEALDGAMTKLQATIAAIARAKKGAGQ